MPREKKIRLPKPRQTTTVVLTCTICPKIPKFSDVSHLLTHLTSKGHLKHRFNVDTAAMGNDRKAADARAQLARFNQWMEQHKIQGLICERQSIKSESKESKKKGFNASITDVKKERRGSSASISSLSLIPEEGDFRAPAAQMLSQGPHLGTFRPTKSSFTSSERDEDSDDGDGEWKPETYTTPSNRARRRISNFSKSPTNNLVDPSLSFNTPSKGSQGEDGEIPSSSEKLKGVIWPGMDLFDTATPSMKKKRNQKKPIVVLENMLACSKAIEPAEVSYHADGTFRKSRDVFGPLSEDDFSPPAKPSPKKGRGRKANPNANTNVQALANLSTNAPRLFRGRKAAPSASPVKNEYLPMPPPLPVFLQTAPTLNPLALARHFAPDDQENDMEMSLTAGNNGKQRGFTVFQDTEPSPGRTESPLEDHSFDFSSHIAQDLNYELTFKSSNFQPSPTPVARSVSARQVNDENEQPKRLRRTLSSAEVSTVHMSNINNPLFNTYGRSLSYGAQNPYITNQSMLTYGSTFHGNFRPVNSSTVSEHRDLLDHCQAGSRSFPQTGDEFQNYHPSAFGGLGPNGGAGGSMF